MFCPPLNGTRAQVWPGSGVEIFRASTPSTRLSVVSTFGRYLNSERWYIGSPASAPASFGPALQVRYGSRPRSQGVNDDPLEHRYTESYVDRAMLTDIDWTTKLPSFWLVSVRWTPPQSTSIDA